MPDRRSVALALCALAGVVALDWLLGLERVVLRTELGSAHVRETSLWVADDGLYLWIQAPSAELDWFRAVVANPLVEVRRFGRTERFRAEVIPGEARRVERLYREKYGLAHAALGLLRDRARAIPIRLARLPDGGTRA
jgi:hypothetical protein